MKSRSLLLSVLAGFLGLVALLFAANRIFLRSYASLEHRDTVAQVTRALSALNDDLGQLSTTAQDYAGWDDSYRFVLQGTPSFVAENFIPDVFANLRLSFMVYVTSEGNVRHGQGFDLLKGDMAPLPEELLAHLAPGKPLVSHADVNSVAKGVLMLPGGAFLVVSRPVLTSSYEGPIRGSLLMGRALDAAEIARLGEVTHLALSFTPLAGGGTTATAERAAACSAAGGPGIGTFPEGDATIVGCAPVSDLYGKPALLAEVRLPRDIYLQGRQTVRYFLLWVGALGILLAVAAPFLYLKLQASRRKQEAMQERYRAMILKSSDGIALVDLPARRLLECNPAFCRLTGQSAEDLRDRTFADLCPGDTAGVDQLFAELDRGTPSASAEISLRHADGSATAAEVDVTLLAEGSRRLASMVIRDITVWRRHEEELRHLATHDSLTGLPNRTLLTDRLDQALNRDHRKQEYLCLMLLDLDNFKMVNDTLGHALGDKLLTLVAERLRGCVWTLDTVARLGGDEYTVMLGRLSKPEDSILVAERILASLAQPFMVDGHELFVTASIGMTIHPTDGDTAEKLLRNADTAMYHAKEMGRNTYQFFSEAMNRRIGERLALETDLRQALGRGELLLHYQPRVEVASRRIIGMEALLRWPHPQHGTIPPQRFIPVAEDTGLIIPLGEWALASACSQAVAWERAGLPDLTLSVNISGRQFHRQDLAETVARVLGETGLDPGHLELEITESVIMQHAEATVKTLAKLKAMGIRLAIDDFGTGYSSLGYLRQFPVDTLKIDGTFIRDVATKSEDATLVSAIVAMAASLGLRAVAEGVETAEQLECLLQYRCPEIQGFYFSRPLPAQEFASLVANGGCFRAGTA